MKGFVDLRVATNSDLNAAIANVAGNGVYFSPSFLRLKSERMMNPMSFDKILSDREMEVLSLIAAPFSDQEIADELGISQLPAEKHRFNMMRKLGLTSTMELTRFLHVSRGIALHPPRSGCRLAFHL